MRQLAEVRAAIATACRGLAAQGLVRGTAGNVSISTGTQVAITATGAAFDTITANEVVIVDRDGRVVAGELAPTSELDLHLGIYRDTDANAVVHTHAPQAIAAGLVTDELPCIHYQMLALGGAVRVAPYATFGTPELAGNVRAALAGRTAALMANHGAVTYGADLHSAIEATLLLEWACGIYLQAASIAEPRALDAPAQRAVVAAATLRNYGTPRPLEQTS